MTKKRMMVFCLFLLLFVISFAILSLDVVGEEKAVPVYEISVITRGPTSDSWTSIRQGAEQAASERNVSLSFITLSEENAQAEQSSYLYRELDGGADAVILSAASYGRAAAPVGRIAEKIPVVCIESNADSPAVSAYLSADNYRMGAELGEKIVSGGFAYQRRIAILDTSAECENIAQRRTGILDAFGKSEQFAYLARWPIPNGKEMAAELLREKLRQEQVNTLIALEPSALELAAQVSAELELQNMEIYGIGNSGRIASYLEQDIISATVVQNDFAIGYLAVRAAVEAIEKRPTQSTTVEHRLIQFGNMYDPENQRLLFPFIR